MEGMGDSENQGKERRPKQLYKGDLVTTRIEDIGSSGEGIGRVDGFTLFIKDALPGDTVLAKIMKIKKGYGFARLTGVTEPSPFRVAPRCEIARSCGGCQLQELSYEQQLVFKRKKVRDDLIRIAGFSAEIVDAVLCPVIGMEEPWRFRNKAQLPVGKVRGEIAVGFYAGRTHCIIPVRDCLIGKSRNNQIIRIILSYMKRWEVPAYNEASGEGLLRHVLIRSGYYSGEIMVCLVVNGESLPQEEWLIQQLRTIPGICSISANCNRTKTNGILGKSVRTLWGKGTISDSLQVLDVDYDVVEPEGRPETKDLTDTKVEMEDKGEGIALDFGGCGAFPSRRLRFHKTGRFVNYEISPLSFYQVNPLQTQRLYSLVRFFAALSGREILWDLYCGVGTISCFLAPKAREVYGVEVIPEAISDARRNAEKNGLTNITFSVGRVEDVLPAYVKEEGREVDVVVVDPPRKGCDQKCLEAILEASPQKVIYVSCDPATMARDLKILTDGGYAIQVIQPVDQFPHSVHIETVCLLSKHFRKLNDAI